MHTVSLAAHFDGQQIVLDEPYELGADTELIVTVLPKRDPEEEERRQTFHQALLDSGLVKRLAKPRPTEEASRVVIEAQGEPVSETILRERR